MKIKPAYQHSKLGTFMFNLCARWTEFLVKHRALYYILACTWGILMTLFGIVLTIVLFIPSLFSKRITFKKYYWIYSLSIGPDYWGGFETGLMFCRDQKSSEGQICPHEFGHTFQNTLLGPFAIFLCFIPSAVRYWYQTIRENHGKDNKPYDSAWFEDAATQCGRYAVEYIIAKKNENKTK